MGMFDSYDDLGNNYTPNNICPPTEHVCPAESKLAPCSPNKPYADYNSQGELTGYWWYYKNILNLEFNITGEVVVEGSVDYIDATDFLEDKSITVTLYNFRREIITVRTYPGSTTIIFEIDKELSNILVPGIYYCAVTVWEGEDYNQTIFHQIDCTLTVK